MPKWTVFCAGLPKRYSVYLAYALFCEGPSDFAYFEVLIPRVIAALVAEKGIRLVDTPTEPSVRLGEMDGSVRAVAAEACRRREAFHIVFVHSDVGGRGQEKRLDSRSISYCEQMSEICDFPQSRCVTLTPRHMMEAWALADPDAVLGALGYKGSPASIGLPRDGGEAERLADPKATLDFAVGRVTNDRRRGGHTFLPAIAQRQAMNALRRASSFGDFESRLQVALRSLGTLRSD
ncbi:MAG: hypothetical protein OXU77_18745 [Gammaproteobacteria bacterium]|nr:hypothetical protein [Gammaproteobacteria bacterium]